MVSVLDNMRNVEMIGSEAPCQNQNPLKALSLVATNGTLPIANPENLMPAFRDYLAKTLDIDVEKRPDATRLLRHPFFAIAVPSRMLVPLVRAARDCAETRRTY